MALSDIYPAIKRSIVAFVPRYAPDGSQQPMLPPIIGTGFVVRQDGVIITNHHVIRAFAEVFRPSDLPDSDWGVDALLFFPADSGVRDIRLAVMGVARIGSGSSAGPDLGLVHVRAAGLIPLTMAGPEAIAEGAEIATAGFPLGRHALEGPGGLYQLSPTLQKGIISAVLPFPGPGLRAFSINIMSHGGASGSPVFLTDSGKVVGILYSALTDTVRTTGEATYAMPTNISYAIPAFPIPNILARLKALPGFAMPGDAPTLDRLICERTPGHAYENGVCHQLTPADSAAKDHNLEMLNPVKKDGGAE